MYKESFMLEINNIKKYYGSFIALNNISFKLKPRRISCPTRAKWSRKIYLIFNYYRISKG